MAEIAAMRDAEARRAAATTFDRNVMVTASAGTGKTTLLVDRLVQLLLKPHEPVALADIVALTFMEKAANDMKGRLRARLLELLADPESLCDADKPSALSVTEVRERAERALQELERSQIGTIHRFAAHLLRLYPIEAGVDPRFEPDDGQKFDTHFTKEWNEWLNVELGSRGLRHDAWRQALRTISMESLRELARKLANDLVPLSLLAAQFERTGLSPAVRQWLEESRARARILLTGGRNGPKDMRQVEKLLTAAECVFTQVLSDGVAAVGALPADSLTLLLDKNAGSKPPSEWSEPEFDEAVDLIATAKSLVQADQALVRTILTLLMPFADRCRRQFLEAGFIGFDGLLARARDLLKFHPEIRKRLKQQFKAILVDEFQDTDPVQYEILLYLSERTEESAARWQDIRLQPGKLFIVGDPKQSIFAFRRADIEAFQLVGELIVRQGGLPLTLSTNFRSHASILHAVNGIFERLIVKRPGLQPAYDGLEPQAERKTAAGTQGVVLRLVAQNGEEEDGEELNAEEAVRSEAEAVARWLKTEVIGKEVLIEAAGRRRSVEPGDVALLFRTFSQSREYLDALRRHGLPYVAEGEKHFYQRQEVVDFVNVLRCIQNPDDAIARVAVLRSPVGALTDREIVDLSALGALDYRPGRHPNLDRHPKAEHLRRLYSVLQGLHEECGRSPLSEAVHLIFDRLPLVELAAASLHGEQAVANLWKVRALTEDVEQDPALTMAAFVELLTARVADPPQESESGLAEESLEAVRVMSVHKAKGLEFPIVVLVGMQTGTLRQREDILVHHDWSTDVVGVRVDGVSTLEGVFIAKKLEARMNAERRRLLYVAMTRAKERLVLSGAVTRRPGSGNFLTLCRDALGDTVGQEGATQLAAGRGWISQAILPAVEGKLRRKKSTDRTVVRQPGLAEYAGLWQRRDAWCAQRRATSVVATPTSVAQMDGRRVASRGTAHAALLGSVAHTVLQQWDYAGAVPGLLDLCDRQLESDVPTEQQADRDELRQALRDMLEAFARSDAYMELAGATILGCEIPFIMPLCSPSPPGYPLLSKCDGSTREGGGEGGNLNAARSHGRPH